MANDPWWPWTTVESRPLAPRGADPKMNTYHAHLMPWRDAAGGLVVSVSNNARDMLRDAWSNPARYRPTLSTSPWYDPPAPPAPTTSPPPLTTTSSTTTTNSTSTSTTPSVADPGGSSTTSSVTSTTTSDTAQP